MPGKLTTHGSRRNNRLQAYILKNEELFKPRKERKEIDLEQVKSMAAIGCTQAEMAALLGCSVHWLNEQMDSNPAMAQAYEEGSASMRSSLRRTQIAMAMNGNATMLIWLGKQLLGQSDKQLVENKTEINITVQRAMDELRNIPKDQLLAAQELLSMPMIESQAIELPADSACPSPPPPPCVE